MSQLLQDIDSRTRLAGTNQLEILLFSLGGASAAGRGETFGINVFKVREVLRAPEITPAPQSPPGVVGMMCLRDNLIPVLDLAHCMGLAAAPDPQILIVTEYNEQTQGFLVHAVDAILRLEWSRVRVPPRLLHPHMDGRITAVIELEDGQLAMMVDVERVLHDVLQPDDAELFAAIKPLGVGPRTVFCADDSAVARLQIKHTLEALGLAGRFACNGQVAWEDLLKLADKAQQQGRPVTDYLHVILTDVEMPEMDGYVLTKKIKADDRFNGIPVIMHTSLSSDANRQLGMSVGVDEYIPKFAPEHLAQVLERVLT